MAINKRCFRNFKIPPGEKHGLSHPSTPMTYLAVQESLEGKAVELLGKKAVARTLHSSFFHSTLPYLFPGIGLH